MSKFVYNDGGRKDAGYKGKTGDCATRAISIVTGIPYQQVYDDLNQLAQKERTGKRKKSVSNSRTGVYKNTVKNYMNSLGYKWIACMGIGTGCKVHLRKEELPPGRLLVFLSRHYVAVVDGNIHDTYDCSRSGKRCVYGYFIKMEDK